MKRTLLLAAALAVVLAGCASSPTMGGLYTNVKLPVSANGRIDGCTKTGETTIMSIMGIALGDASIDSTAKLFGITEVKYVDAEAFSVLGVYGRYTTRVYGN